MTTVRVRLRAGTREIEVEAPSRADVDELLSRWWDTGGGDSEEVVEAPAAPAKSDGKRSKGRSRRSGAAPEGNAFGNEANSIANDIKEHEHFPTMEKKVFHAAGEPYRKVACVLWASEEALTSGQIHKVLQALGVRADLPTLSKALKKNMGSFIISGTRKVGAAPAEYKLTGKAKTDFEKWLLTNETGAS